MATYVIGDVQGCFDELQALLSKIHFNVESDALWLVGDLVNRGPKSLEVLRFCKNFPGELHCVLGNHDLHLLAAAAGVRPAKPLDTFSDVLSASDREPLLAWLKTLPLLHHNQSLNTVMAHAGIYPLWTLAQAKNYAKEVSDVLQSNSQDFFKNMYGNVPERWDESLQGWDRIRFIVNAFTRMRALNADKSLNLTFDGAPENIPEGCAPWFHQLPPEYQSMRIVFGHWAALQGKTHVPNVFALDTGCVWGKTLTALRLEDEQRFSVQSSSHPATSLAK